MARKAYFNGHGFALLMTAAGVAVVAAIIASTPSLTQTAPAGGILSIQRGSDAEKALNLKKPSHQREKPLDWKRTMGKPIPRVLTPAEEEALRRAQPRKTKRVAPNPNARKTRAQSSISYPMVGELNTADEYCSASVVGVDLIATAAHCCWDRSIANPDGTSGKWIGGWSFAPGYDGGDAPYGWFDWEYVTVVPSWADSGDTTSDVCLIQLQKDANGNSVTDIVGAFGLAANEPPSQYMTVFGYPYNIGGGVNRDECVGQSSAPSGFCGLVLNMSCDMTDGSSGGPWIMDLGIGDHIDSVVHGYDSLMCSGGPYGQVFSGPQFNDNNILALCNDPKLGGACGVWQ
jgi:V8-like Glu-specific endopeptidase